MRFRIPPFLFLLLSVLAGCGGGSGGGGSTPPPTTDTIGGFVKDLVNSPVILLDNGTDKVTVPTYGSFTFPTPVPNGSTYNVTVGAQPANGQTCIVQNPTGVATSNVTSILVTCLAPFKVGGTVFGLSGSGLTLADNGGDLLAIDGNGTFQFASKIKYGDSYSVTIATQPVDPAQRCTVTNGSGTPQGDVSNVLVSCGSAEPKWTWMGGSQSTALAGIYGTQGVPSAANNPGARGLGVSWTDPAGGFWLFGGTYTGAGNNLNDLWKYAGGEWTWVSGSSAGDNQQSNFGTKGTASASNVPGARVEALSWSDSAGNLWLFGGTGADTLNYHWYNDLWRFSGNEWTWISGSNEPDQPPVYGTRGVAAAGNVPGARYGAMGWVDAANNLWLFGGRDVNVFGNGGSSRDQNDLWKFDGHNWTWVAGLNDPTTAQNGVYGTLGRADAANTPGARESASTWIDASGALWLFGGMGQDSAGTNGYLNDLWRFKDGGWTWMGGSKLAGDLGTFGTMGVADAANIPPARALALNWTDAAGNFWLFGGGGYDRSGADGGLNDLWRYSAGQWTYMSGSQLAMQVPSYGPLGEASADSLPGGCVGSIQWLDMTGRLWAYCENENDQEGLITSANDLWVYQP